MRIAESTTEDGGFRGHRQKKRRHRAAGHLALLSGRMFRLRPRVHVMEDRTLLSSFLVTTTADSGPGSLRAAILDSNAATGTSNTIDFGIPGSGVRTIAPGGLAPANDHKVGTDRRLLSGPGYAATPVVEIDGSPAAPATAC